MALINYCDYEIKGTLTVGGIITAPGGTSTEWNTSYDNMVTGIAFSGTTTKTLTLTQQDGGVLTASFTDNNDNTNYYTTTATFNTSNGIISFSGAGGQPAYSVDIDGRYALSSVVSGVTSINFKTDGTALNVASNTITTSGTMTGVWQGTSSQYVNGEGNLITFPSVAGTYNFDLTGDSGTSATVTSGSTVSIIGSSTISTTSNGFNVSIEATTAAVANGGTALASGDQIYDFVIGQLPSVNNNTITLSAGTGLSGGGAFTLNQSSNETITFNNSITNNNQLTNGSGYITASSTDTLTNKSGNISQWTNDSGYTTNVGDITAVTAGSGLTGGGTSGSVSLAVGAGTLIDVTSTAVNVDLSELSQATGDMISTDYFVITLAGGTQYKTIPGNVPNNLFPNDAGYTTNVGDITGVTAGNKLTGGGTSGTVTLGLASDNISQWTNDSGYTTNVGDITAVTVTAPITGGGTSGSVGIGITQATTSANGYLSSTDWNTFNNKTGNTGDITGVTAGTNLTGGGTSGSVTLNMATGGAGAASYGSTSDSIKIDTITLDAYGRVTAVATGATGQVNTVATGNSSTLTSSGTTAKTLTPVTATVNASSAALATGAQIQTAINSALTGVLQFEGTWNASTNSPSLSSGTGTSGDYYIVSVAGSTNLDGITDWAIGDWAVFANTTWTKIDNSQVGNVTGSGSSGRVAYWNSTSGITSDAGLTFDGGSNALTVSGAVTWSGGSSGESNSAYDNMITGFGNSGSSTKLLTLTQQDGGTLTTSFSIPQGTVTSVNFKTDGTALNVNSNTITTSGTMTGVWQGTSGQYVNGLGDLTTFPSIPQGDITGVTAGTGMSGGGTSGTVTLNCTITNNNQLTNGAGYITGVTAGVGLSGGGTSGTPTLTLDLGELGAGGTLIAGDYLIAENGGVDNRQLISSIPLSIFNNNSGWTNVTNNNQITNGAGYITSYTNTQNIFTSSWVDSGTNALLRLTKSGASTGTQDITITPSTGISVTPTTSNLIITNTGNTTIGTNSDITLNDATVLQTLNMTQGVVTSFITRTLTLSNLGYSGATNANYITNNNQLTNGAGYITSAGNQGTVTSVGITAGTGISVSNSPITSSGNITVTNTSPNVAETFTSWIVRDDDNDDKTLSGSTNKYLKFAAATGTSGTNLTGTGTTADPYLMTITSPDSNSGGTVTGATSGSANTITVSASSTSPVISAVTAAVVNGGTALATGDQINDFVKALNYGSVTSVTAGTGMTQTGTSTINPTLNVIGGDGIVAVADKITVDSTVVRTTITQSIGGTKTFTTTPISVTRSTADNSTYLATTAFVKNQGYTTNTGTVTSVATGTGLTGGTITGSGTVSVDYAGSDSIVMAAPGGSTPDPDDYFIYGSDSSDDGSSLKFQFVDTPLSIFNNDLKSQTQFTSNFLDSSSSTSYFYIPFNSTSESTSSQYYNHLACAQPGTVKKIMMMHTSGTASTSFTTQLRVVKNGITAATSGELTPSNGANDGSYVEYLPNTTFVKGDRIRIGYQKSATSKYWQGVSAIVIFEFTPV